MILNLNEPKWQGFAELVPNWGQMEIYGSWITRILYVTINVLQLIDNKRIYLYIEVPFSIKYVYI